MRLRKRAGTFLVLAILIAAAMPAAAGTLEELFAAASASNQDYAVLNLDLELAKLRKTKGDIEAKVELDRLQAQSSYVSALASYRRSVLNFYNEVIDAAFAVATAELDVESLSLSLQNALVDKESGDTRFKSGLISEAAFKEIEIAYKTQANNFELAQWTLEDAKRIFFSTTGLEWASSLLPDIDSFENSASLDQWLVNDTSVQLAQVAEKIQDIKTVSLAANASAYDKKIQDTEQMKAKVSLNNAESDARRLFESGSNNLKNQKNLLQIRLDEYALKESAYEDGLRQYEKGIISQSEKNQRRITLITANKNLLAAKKNYLKSVGSFLSALGENPLGI